MPHSLPSSPKSSLRDGGNGITKFTNCRVLKGDRLVTEDLWVSGLHGTIIKSQAAFYDDFVMPDEVIDLGGRIVAPGFIDCQLNGAFGFNFSTLLDPAEYAKKVREVNRKLVQTGVTSYLPTITSQLPEIYHTALPHLGPSGDLQMAEDGAESLGAHCEGPFLSKTKNGIHNAEVLIEATSFADLEACYGASNLTSPDPSRPPAVRKITAAPEIASMTDLIPEITQRGIVFSIGHTEATYEDASAAVGVGATMITHLFNAMRPLHHRNPGVFGVLGIAESLPRPYFGIIADGEHLHPTTIKIAFNAHPEGFILVTDAMHMVGLPDGAYQWTNGDCTNRIVKKGPKLILEGSDRIAGSSITLVECVNNFLAWSGASIPQALNAVTSTPARMLGLQGKKGCLDEGADADLVILSETTSSSNAADSTAAVGRSARQQQQLVVDEVWKFGAKVFSRKDVAA
ncbi:family 9 carbohydrate esterase [Microdochium trichocladiopsis]|uniref:N-acetylglucosamine-6-phosphate deacetylase n=1 Tax=Microdochium trichocladiopsis TaxID=1682393 RepID=A0A9P8YEF6_9PEZI|nr:family 9 carbohydrate esterase [Microdochium trichocladiopsis]KAH7040277.1 family 9 carbohydrate esterase [Microdochium trichocladiopsis]